MYVFSVQWANLLNKYLPDDVAVTVVETAASIENIERMERGEFALHTVSGPDQHYQAIHGLGPFVGKPQPSGRHLFAWSLNYHEIVVREDSGIKSLDELAGKKFAPGPPGSFTNDYATRILNILGIKADFLPGSFADAASALKDKRIVGLVKPWPTNTVDSVVLDVIATTKLRILPFTKEQSEKVKKEAPWINWATLKAGYWKEFPDMPEYITYFNGAVTAASAKIVSEELGYKMTKVSIEHMDELAAAWPPVKIVKPVDTLLEILNSMPDPPRLHAGTVKYYKEKGYTIPANIVPPEMKK